MEKCLTRGNRGFKWREMKRAVCYGLYYLGVRWLPPSYVPGYGVWRKLRYIVCRPLFDRCGQNVNIESRAYFGSGKNISIGDRSGIGVNAFISGTVSIGNDVMMGHDVMIIGENHEFSRTDITMTGQGLQPSKPIKIGNDVWIGARVVILPGVSIGSGVVIGAGAVITKDIPDWAIAVGNPARIVRYRKTGSNNVSAAN
jgi:maltose O-acetyltransferase